MGIASKVVASIPLLFTLAPQGVSAASTADQGAHKTEDQMVVTANVGSAESPYQAKVEGNASGGGFKTNNIDLGPLGTKAWIDTPYSSTTVTQQTSRPADQQTSRQKA